jgi:hypothetical protein
VVGPAVAELVAVVLLAQDGVGPLAQPVEPRRVGAAVQADPVRGGGAAGCGGVERLGQGPEQGLYTSMVSPGR